MFSINEALTSAWAKTKGNLRTLILITVVMLVVQIVLGGLTQYAEVQSAQIGPVLMQIVTFLISGVISVGMAVIALKVVDGKKPVVADLFTHYAHLWRYIGANVLVFIAGFLLLLIAIALAYAEVPPIIIAISGVLVVLALSVFFSFVVYEVVDKGARPVAAIRGSVELARKAVFPLLGFVILLVIINLVGALLLLVGLLVTIPLTSVAMAQVYRTLDMKETVGQGLTK